ncbi:MAG TPA: glycoside hydrolase family 30 beta sandwich domain-containing protein [Bryobacteraceae bacterium]|nr:glycoside hydrolase family 30 beta sandwich domain-containing protein [Bryobacteraceae bacterium]
MRVGLTVLFTVLAAVLPAPGQNVQVFETDGDQSKLLAQRSPGLTFAPGPPAGSPAFTIAVDGSTMYQQMDGVGASLTDSAGWVIWNDLTEPQRDALMQSLFDPNAGIGIGILRQPMGASDFSASGDYSYDDAPSGQSDPNLAQFSIAHDQTYLIPLLQQALAINPSLKVHALPWSPPAWMKTTGTMNGGNIAAADFPSLAQYFTRFIDAYQQHGIPVYAVSMQNEPLNSTTSYPSAYVSSSDEANFIGNYLGPALVGAGLGGVKIFGYEHNWDQPQYPEALLADSAAYGYLAGSSFHCYAGGVVAQSQVKQAYPTKDIWFTECSGTVGFSFAGDLAWNAENLLIGATRNWARGVTLWNVALDQNSGPQNGGCTACRGVVTVDDSVTPPLITRNVEYYVLGHLGKFVQPGAYRIDSNTYGSGSLEDVAFQNPDGSIVLLVLNAASGSSTFAVTWNGGNFTDTLPAGAVATYEWAVPAPAFPANGAINAAAPQAALSPGELFSIYGVNLAAQAQQPLLLPLPATMAAASVEIGGIAAPLAYVSPSQINAQVPWEVAPGSATLTVTHAGVTASQTVTIAAAGPAIFTLYGSPEAAALNQDYAVNSQDNPAGPGQAVLLFGTGLGAVSPAVPTGAAASADTLSYVSAKVTATVGGTPADVLFAGLAPGFAGLWQVNLALPSGVAGAAPVTLPVIVSVAGVASNTVTVWVE